MESSNATSVTGVAIAAISVSGSRKRVKISPKFSKQQPENQWKNPAQAKIYSQRLLNSLRHLTINDKSSSSSYSPPPSRAIKEAADTALAETARGKTRWSKAILSRRWRMKKVVAVKPNKVKKRKKKEKEREKEGVGLKGEKRKVKEKLKVLGHLVPGCRKASTASLLEEAVDYVAALELQVKAMKALADALSSVSAISGASSSSAPLHN